MCSKDLSRGQASGCTPADSSPQCYCPHCVCLPTFHRIISLFLHYFWKPGSILSYFRKDEGRLSSTIYDVVLNATESSSGSFKRMLYREQVGPWQLEPRFRRDRSQEASHVRSFNGMMVRIKCPHSCFGKSHFTFLQFKTQRDVVPTVLAALREETASPGPGVKPGLCKRKLRWLLRKVWMLRPQGGACWVVGHRCPRPS